MIGNRIILNQDKKQEQKKNVPTVITLNEFIDMGKYYVRINGLHYEVIFKPITTCCREYDGDE